MSLSSTLDKDTYSRVSESIESYLNITLTPDTQHLREITRAEIEDNLCNVDISAHSIESLPYLSSAALRPKRWKSEIERNRRNIERQDNLSSIDNFKCSKCGGTKASMMTLQSSSGDEPMTTYITCASCQKTISRR